MLAEAQTSFKMIYIHKYFQNYSYFIEALAPSSWYVDSNTKYMCTTDLPFMGISFDMGLVGIHYLTSLKVVSSQILLFTTLRLSHWLGTIHWILLCPPQGPPWFSDTLGTFGLQPSACLKLDLPSIHGLVSLCHSGLPDASTSIFSGCQHTLSLLFDVVLG